MTAAATAGLLMTAFGASASAQETTYTVQPGDSLWKISHLKNVSINNLKDWNHLSDDQIYVNQKLSLAYTVKPGDTLWAIARSYGTTVSELKSLNGLSSDLLQIGQQLRIPNVKSVTPVSHKPASVTPVCSPYVVQRGDSLYKIGKRFNLSVAQLKSLNQLTTDTIYPGQTLKVDGAPKVSAASTTNTAQTHVKSDSVEKPAAQASSNSNQTTAQNKNTASVKPAVKPDVKETQKPAASNQAAPSVSKPAQNQTAPSVSKPAQNQAAPSVSKPVQNQTASSVSKPAVSSNSNVSQQAPASSTADGQAIIAYAEKFMGTPYSWGGNTPAGFDCSGFTKYVFNHFGISLPRTTSEQWNATSPVSSPRTGDLVFFQTYKLGPSHVGIYIGNNKFISAAANGVTISDLTATYWSSRYLGARSVN